MKKFKVLVIYLSGHLSLQLLKLDMIENKQFLCSYIEDGSQCKAELYTVDNKPSRILRARLFTTGRILDWLIVKEVDGEKRYYYEGEDPLFS